MAAPSPYLSTRSRKSFLRAFQGLVREQGDRDGIDFGGSIRLGRDKIRLPTPALPLQLRFGNEETFGLQLMAETVVDATGRFRRTQDYLLFDPERYFDDISGFLRLAPGESLTLGRADPLQQLLLQCPQLVEERHLRLKLTSKGLTLKRKSRVQGARVVALEEQEVLERYIRWRRNKIEHLATLLAAPIEPPSRGEALALLERVTAILEEEPYRLRTRDGRPGAILQLPDRPAPIIVGDLHARIDNLLVVLTQNGFLESLQGGSAALIMLGDAVHPAEPGCEDEMDTSMLMMDLILRLKALFPDRVFYLRGNHDSFSEAINKGGVPQGLVWEKALQDRRGPRYRGAMQRFYDLLPYVAISPHLLACHAGAPTIEATRDELIHLRDHPELEHQMTHVGPNGPKALHGDRDAHAGHLRRRLGLEPETPFIVGHTTESADATCWLNVGGAAHHHVLSSANPNQVGVITRPGRNLVPLRYPAEPLLPVYNRLVKKGRWKD